MPEEEVRAMPTLPVTLRLGVRLEAGVVYQWHRWVACNGRILKEDLCSSNEPHWWTRILKP